MADIKQTEPSLTIKRLASEHFRHDWRRFNPHDLMKAVKDINRYLNQRNQVGENEKIYVEECINNATIMLSSWYKCVSNQSGGDQMIPRPIDVCKSNLRYDKELLKHIDNKANKIHRNLQPILQSN